MKVKLPSDSLTPAQLRKQSGAVVEYNLGKPMTYEQLVLLPDDLKKKYLDKLVAEYNANQVVLAEMLGIHRQTLSRRCKEWGVSFPQGAAAIMQPDEKLRFIAWKNGVTALAPVEDKPTTPAPVVAAQITKAPEPATAKLTAGHMEFHGPAGAALRQVYDLLGETPCTVTIVWKIEEADDNVPL